MAGYLGTYLAMAYSIVGICVYIALRMFYGILQVIRNEVEGGGGSVMMTEIGPADYLTRVGYCILLLTMQYSILRTVLLGW